MFMCRRHWYMVPRTLRSAIWRTYSPGQEIRRDPSPEYLRAAIDAVKVVAQIEAGFRR